VTTNGVSGIRPPDGGGLPAAINPQTVHCEVRPSARTDGTLAEYDDGYRRSAIAVAYWAAWVALGAWGFRFLFSYRRSALWMVLAAFLLTNRDVLPAYRVRRPLRAAALLLASLACATLLYCTSDWWFAVFEGWHSSNNDPWVRQTLKRVWFPALYILGTLLTAGILVLPFKRALGELTVVALATLGVLTTVLVQSDLILSTAAWHHDWLVSAMLLFRALIVGLGAAAIAARVRSPENPYAWCPLCERIWRGAIPVPWGIALYLTSILASLGLFLFFGISYNTHGPNGSLRVGIQLMWVCLGEVLPVLLFLAGSLIALRTLGEAAARRPWSSRIAQALIMLILIPIAVTVARWNGFSTGEQLQSSLAVVLGTAYSYRLTPDGSGLVFDGNVTYGVADQLKRELSLHPAVRRLILISGGGLIDEARATADIIANAQLDTVVENSCDSACILMFLAGTHRTLVPPGKLGFHRLVTLNPLVASAGIGSCSEYARYRVSKDFCRQVDVVVPPAIWYPTQEELVAAHVISGPTPVTR
jgi:hypothetical protein